MRDYFYNAIARSFGNAIYTMFGSVAVRLYRNEEQTKIRYVAYSISNDELQELDKEEWGKHVKIEKSYDISDVNFSDRMSVLQKISTLVTSFEMDVYSMEPTNI